MALFVSPFYLSVDVCVCVFILIRYLQKKKQKDREKKMSAQERHELEYQRTGSVKRDEFEGVEKVRFGDRVDAPPVLPKLKGIFKKRAEAAQKAKVKVAAKKNGRK